MAGAGFATMITAGPLPTPVVAFGIRHFGCVAAVVVTASHNPPQDNGYKVYLGDGSQIVPPADAEIAARIDEVAKHRLDDVPRSAGYATLGDELVAAYLERIAALVPAGCSPRLSTGSTPHCTASAARSSSEPCGAAGFPAGVVVAEQAQPDPDFPTVAFPNPEEPGAIDLALAQAQEVGADLVVANDPDADRCAVAAVVDAELADAARRRARGPARRRRAAPRRTRDVRVLDRLRLAAPGDGRGVRAAVRLHAHRLQVDRPGARAGVRLRGGHRLLRRPGRCPGQGRDLRAGPGAHRWPPSSRRTGAPWPTGWTRSP